MVVLVVVMGVAMVLMLVVVLAVVLVGMLVVVLAVVATTPTTLSNPNDGHRPVRSYSPKQCYPSIAIQVLPPKY